MGFKGHEEGSTLSSKMVLQKHHLINSITIPLPKASQPLHPSMLGVAKECHSVPDIRTLEVTVQNIT